MLYLNMLRVVYPTPEFRIKTENGKPVIFDALRKRWLPLTDEEWVRQNFVQYLVRVKNYPATLIAQEKEISLGELKKRFDILVYDRKHQPWMMIECKGPGVQLAQSTLEQVLRYNISVPVKYIVISNGEFNYGWEKKGTGLSELYELPDSI